MEETVDGCPVMEDKEKVVGWWRTRHARVREYEGQWRSCTGDNLLEARPNGG